MKRYVYLVEGHEIFKIGITSNPIKRMKTYKTHNPELKFICFAEAHYPEIERIMHMEMLKNGWRKHRQQPEWFEGTPPTKEFFQEKVHYFNESLKQIKEL